MKRFTLRRYRWHSAKPQQPVDNHGVFVGQLALVAVASLAYGEVCAGLANAGAACLDRPSGHLTSLRWPDHFFCEGFLHDLGPHLHLRVDLLQAPILFLQFLDPGHHRRVRHPPRTPTVTRRQWRTNAIEPAILASPHRLPFGERNSKSCNV